MMFNQHSNKTHPHNHHQHNNHQKHQQHNNNNNNNNNSHSHNHHPPKHHNRSNPFVLADRRYRLPVYRYKDTLLKLLNENESIIVVGETGSGKTTQIPQWCIDFVATSGREQCAVACTQPRRIAAMSVAQRVAKEMRVELGHEVGYSVRFENSTSSKTKLKYLTDGMLLREAMLDNLLSSYNVIILDEAHERTLQTEILFGVIKRALAIRNHAKISESAHNLPSTSSTETSIADKNSNLDPLKVIVMSATMNVKLFKKYFNLPPVLHIEGRQHPVQEMFAEVSQADLLTATLITVFQIHRTQNDGDILVFCSGQDEILSLITLTKRVLKHAPESLRHLTPLPLYASLPACNQMRVFEAPKKVPITYTTTQQTNGFSGQSSASTATTTNGTHSVNLRRVIFSTNVAETSVTIPNVKYVVDTGKVKCRTYCPTTGLESLKVTSISKAQSSQRTGRAGRVAPGTCYRLYTSEEYAQMPDHQLPEIKRCNLDSVLLQVISIGFQQISTFDFLDKPEPQRIYSALKQLISLNAIRIANKSNHNNYNKAGSSQSNSQSTNHDEAGTSSQQQQKKIKFNHIFNNNKDSSSDDGSTLLNLSFELTPQGKRLCAFPLNPAMGRVILAADSLGCLDEAITIISLLSVENLFYIPPNKQAQADAMLDKFRSNEGDTIMMLKVWKAFKRALNLDRPNLKVWCNEHFIHTKNMKTARLIRKQLWDLCKNQGMPASTCGQQTSMIRLALYMGFPNNIATMWNGKYKNQFSQDILIHPSSCLFKSRPNNVLYFEIVETNKCYMRVCTLIDETMTRDRTLVDKINA